MSFFFFEYPWGLFSFDSFPMPVDFFLLEFFPFWVRLFPTYVLSRREHNWARLVAKKKHQPLFYSLKLSGATFSLRVPRLGRSFAFFDLLGLYCIDSWFLFLQTNNSKGVCHVLHF